MNNLYKEKVRLLLSVLPFLSEFDELALKGGTAINFFIHTMPRLSVDIDLTFLPVRPRDTSIKQIKELLKNLSKSLERSPFKLYVENVSRSPKLIIKSNNVQIKLEVNTTFRGFVYKPQKLSLTERIQDEFETFAECICMSTADLYGSKICAALDRQHPRDLFDVNLMLKHTGITEEIRKAFICYLISHPRPINELLSPNNIDFSSIFEKEFKGMANDPVSIETLIDIQENLPKIIRASLTETEKVFLISVKEGNPDWSIMDIPGMKELPGIKWKLHNIRLLKQNRRKHQYLLQKLRTTLET